ncbi:hypothetical protein Celaphus_00017492 [Cervus elaphus hippelaphus]|uniref:Uncharacterized protein n=1 Tax=Cervus elaphus hippelaphus TaxID=46360 RepID=A0A212D5P8_CEREH|nr:hypothetical protein Celaphus_00017492 [Cervus elaphus hippelaphus]
MFSLKNWDPCFLVMLERWTNLLFYRRASIFYESIKKSLHSQTLVRFDRTGNLHSLVMKSLHN